MNTSQDIGELAKALAAAQTDLKNPKFDSTNPHFKSKYASLASVRDTVNAAMTKHGISVVQELRSAVGASGVECLTRLIHTSGQWIEFGPAFFPAQKNDAQGFGAASTYARRFTLQAAAGVVGDDDDDGNAASGKAPTKNAELDAFPPKDGPIGKPAAKAAAPRPTYEANKDAPMPILVDLLRATMPIADERKEFYAAFGCDMKAGPALNYGLKDDALKKLRAEMLSVICGDQT